MTNNVTVDLIINVPAGNVKAKVSGVGPEFKCVSLDNRLQTLGYTPGAALDIFLARLAAEEPEWKTKR
jgi:hypothetical protein